MRALINFSLLSYFLVLTPFVYSKCSGFVDDYRFDNFSIFNGECSKDGARLWGEDSYLGDNSGDKFTGFFKSNLRHIGIYEWANGESLLGENFLESSLPSNNGYEYDFFGKLNVNNRNTIKIGFFKDNESNGFVISTLDPIESDKRIYEAGITVGGYLSGYGMRKRDDGTETFAYWENGGAIGDYYVLSNGDYIKYNRNKNDQYKGPFTLTNADQSRLLRIKKFVDNNTDFVNNKWSSFEDSFYQDYDNEVDLYNKWVASFDSESESNESSFSNTETQQNDLVTSIQELLFELNYSPGIPDGILGARTIAAIKAFQYSLEMEPDGIPTEELLILLQLSYKQSNTSSNSDQEPSVVSTGTGFYINKDNLITNNHVIKNCSYLTDDKDSTLEIIVQDEINDLAILKGGFNNSFLNIYKKSPILGEKIYVAGFPYNSDLKGFNFTSGNVSSLMGLGRDVVNFQITAPVQPGNSGGAVINEYGSVIGVIKYRLDDEYIIGKTDTIPQNINFAIKNTIIKEMMSENNIDYNVDNPFFRSSQKNIAQESKESSILIKCYGFFNES